MFNWKALTNFRDVETEAHGMIMTCPTSHSITRLDIKCLVPRPIFFVKEPKRYENRRNTENPGGGLGKR